MSDVAKFNEQLALELGVPANMDAQMKPGPFLFEWVPVIHEKGEVHLFQVTDDELEMLVRCWAEELREIWDFVKATETLCGSERRMEDYANYRVGKIEEIIGQERVQRVFDKVMGERRCYREQFEPRVAAAHGLHAAILLESFIQDAEWGVVIAASEGKARCSLTDICLSAPQNPTEPEDQAFFYTYLTQAEVDAGLQKLVEAGLIRESRGESAHERPDGDPKRYFFLTPLALPDASLGDSAKTSEQAHGGTTATDESRSEDVQ